MLRGVPILCLLVFSLTPPEAERADPALRRRIFEILAAREEKLIAFRRDLHRHPELSGAEQRTAEVVSAGLRALGLEPRMGVGGHGVVVSIRGRKPGPLVAFRADMDAVPSDAADPVEFPSLTPGVRHICGHDIHTTIGMALAEGFAAVRDDLAGTVMLLFQPAEERAEGARAMLAAGVFDRGKPAAIFGVHTAPLEVGQLGTTPGVLMPARDGLDVDLSGSGSLEEIAGQVRALVDAVGTIPMAEAMVPAEGDFVFVQTLPPERTGSTMAVRFSLTVSGAAARSSARAKIEQGLDGLRVENVGITHRYREKMVAGVHNDEALTARANESIRSALGEGVVVPITGIIPAFSEDFGTFQDEALGVFWFLGVSNAAKGSIGMPHSPGYVADEGSILVGARAMTAVILDRLATK